MDGSSMIFLVAMFTPGLIRGAFWHDSPAAEGVFWTIATIPSVVGVGWLAEKFFGAGIGPTAAMMLFLLYINYLALKGSSFGAKGKEGADNIDGDENE